MAEANKKFVRHAFTSPKGVFVYPKLKDADTKFKSEGEYSVKLKLSADAPETKALIAKLQPHYDSAIKSATAEFAKLPVASRKKLGKLSPNPFFSTVYDKETEEPTGDIEFKFIMKASGEYKSGSKAGRKWTRKPTIFSAKGVALKDVPEIWGGTIGRISFEIKEGGYFIPGTGAAGLTLELVAAQLITLRSGGEWSAKDHGFGEEEGYEGDTEEATEAGSDAPFDDESAADANAGSEDGDF